MQPAADVSAQRAGIAAAESGVKSAEANDVSTQADIKSRAADLNLVGKAIDYTRAKVIHEDQAMAIKAEIELHQAVLEASEARAKA